MDEKIINGKLNFVETMGERLFYLGDAQAQNAPMIEIRFNNEMSNYPKEKKIEAAFAALQVAWHILNDRKEDPGKI